MNYSLSVSDLVICSFGALGALQLYYVFHCPLRVILYSGRNCNVILQYGSEQKQIELMWIIT